MTKGNNAEGQYGNLMTMIPVREKRGENLDKRRKKNEEGKRGQSLDSGGGS